VPLLSFTRPHPLGEVSGEEPDPQVPHVPQGSLDPYLLLKPRAITRQGVRSHDNGGARREIRMVDQNVKTFFRKCLKNNIEL